MTVGLNPAAGGLANLWLNVLAGTAVGAKTIFAKLHTGDPGAAGATAASGNTTRVSITFASTTSGTISSNNTPSWASWAVGQNGEVISHISAVGRLDGRQLPGQHPADRPEDDVHGRHAEPDQWRHDRQPHPDRSLMNGSYVVWTIVGILLIVVLVLFLLGRA